MKPGRSRAGKTERRRQNGAETTLDKRKTISLAQIVRRLGGELVGDGNVRIRQVATLESAGPGDIAFVAQKRYLAQLGTCRASAVIVGADAREATPMPRIVAANPYAYYAAVASLLNPPEAVRPGVHRTATVDKTARVAASAEVGPYAVIGKGAHVGANTVIGAGCFLGADSRIGAETRLYPRVTVYHACRIGARCIIHSGAVIGADGFGIANDAGTWRKIPQLGGVSIGDDVEVGANTTIDRGALEDTVIGNGVKLDNQIQIAHNVSIGDHTAIAACAGIAGSARIGKHCALGGASMIYGHITITDGVSVSAGTLIMKSLDEPGTYTGVYPFASHPRWLKNAAHLRQLDDLVRRVRELEGRNKDTGSTQE